MGATLAGLAQMMAKVEPPGIWEEVSIASQRTDDKETWHSKLVVQLLGELASFPSRHPYIWC